MKDAIAVDLRHELFDEEHQKDTAYGSEIEVVNQEQGFQLEGLPIAHQLPTAENDHVVDDDEYRGRFQSRHRRFERNESEIVSRIACNGLEGFAEERP